MIFILIDSQRAEIFFISPLLHFFFFFRRSLEEDRRLFLSYLCFNDPTTPNFFIEKERKKKILKKVINKRAIKDEGVEVLHGLQSANLGFILFFEREERSKSRVIITKRGKKVRKK